MTLPASIAVGNHAHDGEITDLQACTAAWLAGHMPAITDFDGADPTGKQDSSNAFSNAFGKIGANALYVPAGTYRVDAGGVSLASGSSLIGAGAQSTVFTYAGTSGCIVLDGCQGSRVENIKILTSSTNAGVRGIWLKNTTSASQYNRIVNNLIVQFSGTGRNAGQVGIEVEDNSALTKAQFWNHFENNRLTSWETCIDTLQSGAGLDGVNQNFFIDNFCAAFITGLHFGARTGDHVVNGLFGSHSDAAVFTDTLMVVGDAATASPNSYNNICTGLVADLGANGRAFFCQANTINNRIIANNESGQADLDSGTNNKCESTKNLSGLNTSFSVPNITVRSSGSSFSGTLLLGKVQEAQSRNVANTDVTLSTTDYLVNYTSLSVDRTVTLPAPGLGGHVIIYDQSGSAAAGVRIIVSGTINGSATTAVAVNTANGCSGWRSNSTTWFKEFAA